MFRNLPQVTKNILLLNITMYIVTMFLAFNGNDISDYLGAHYIGTPLFEPYQVISHMFMHSSGSILHIFFNMFLLVMFGAHLERIWGAKRFFIFYIACGIGAYLLYNSMSFWQIMNLKDSLAGMGNNIGTIDYYLREGTLIPSPQNSQIYINNVMELVDKRELSIHSQSDFEQLYSYSVYTYQGMVGASGAIFGLLAGFAMLFPNTELMLLFIPVPIKAKYLIGGYILFEIYSSFFGPNDGIAHLAHVGGAVVGIIFILAWRKKDRKNFW